MKRHVYRERDYAFAQLVLTLRSAIGLSQVGLAERLGASRRERAGITYKRISPHILRHTFAIRYLVLGNDPFSLQELLGHEDMTTVKNYMHMNDETIQSQKRKYRPGDHLPSRMPGPRETRRRGFQVRNQSHGKGSQR